MTELGAYRGTVREWHEADGWGVVTLEDGRQVWASFADVQGPPRGFKTLQAGDTVDLMIEEGWQDGFLYRALEVRKQAD